MWHTPNLGPSRGGSSSSCPAVAILLAVVLAAGCDAEDLTRPEVRRASLDGSWTGSGSLYLELGWTLTQHAGSDSVTGEGFMDAPSFFDGFPMGQTPEYRLRGLRDGLFVELHMAPVTENAVPLVFRGVMRRAGELRGEVSLRGQGSRLDVITVLLRQRRPESGGG